MNKPIKTLFRAAAIALCLGGFAIAPSNASSNAPSVTPANFEKSLSQIFNTPNHNDKLPQILFIGHFHTEISEDEINILKAVKLAITTNRLAEDFRIAPDQKLHIALELPQYMNIFFKAHREGQITDDDMSDLLIIHTREYMNKNNLLRKIPLMIWLQNNGVVLDAVDSRYDEELLDQIYSADFTPNVGWRIELPDITGFSDDRLYELELLETEIFKQQTDPSSVKSLFLPMRTHQEQLSGDVQQEQIPADVMTARHIMHYIQDNPAIVIFGYGHMNPKMLCEQGDAFINNMAENHNFDNLTPYKNTQGIIPTALEIFGAPTKIMASQDMPEFLVKLAKTTSEAQNNICTREEQNTIYMYNPKGEITTTLPPSNKGWRAIDKYKTLNR